MDVRSQYQYFVKKTISVRILGATSYTFAEATLSQWLLDWLGSHARAFAFFGGVTELVIPDNLKSAVSKPCRYEPDLNPSYQDLAAHKDTAVIPAPPGGANKRTRGPIWADKFSALPAMSFSRSEQFDNYRNRLVDLALLP